MTKTVLLIDDDPNAVRFMSAVLQDNGYETDSAPDGSAGFRRMQETHPDLVILDVMMPKKTGLTFIKQLRRDEEFRDQPVLMVTGVADSLEEMDAESADTNQRPYDSLRESLRKKIDELRGEGLIKPNMFVDKPIEPGPFVERVRELIGS